MAIIAPTFDFMKVSPGDDAHLYNFFASESGVDPDYGDQFQITASGLTATVKTGMAVIKGRMVKNTEPLNIALPANSSGSIVITLDLTKQNTFTGTPGDDNYKPVNNQVRIERVASLVQQDILNGGNIYMFELATYTSNGSTVTLKPTSPNTTGKKNGTTILYKGQATHNTQVELKENPANYKILLVGLTAYGNEAMFTLDRNAIGSFGTGSTGWLNLPDDSTNKSWTMFEAGVEKIGRASCRERV